MKKYRVIIQELDKNGSVRRQFVGRPVEAKEITPVREAAQPSLEHALQLIEDNQRPHHD